VTNSGLKNIESHEWHLWILAFILILFLGTIAGGACFIILSEPGQSLSERNIASSSLVGMLFLLVLFCAYVIHTRITFGKIRTELEESHYDPLMGLYNRQYFNQRIAEEIARTKREKSSFAFLLCDLDNFKTVNDSLGHQVGDEVLKEVAKTFKDSTRGVDLVFRWGGDEIVVILANASREGILVVSERIRKGILKINEKINLNLDVSIGAALCPEHGSNEDELIHFSDRALYIAKKGEVKVRICDEESAEVGCC